MVSNHVESVFQTLTHAVASPYSKKLSAMAAENRITGAQMPVPDEYDRPDLFMLDYTCYSFLRKFQGNSDRADLEKKALLSFKDTEADVRLKGRALQKLISGSPGAEWCISAAQRKIKSILRKFDPIEWLEGCEWGPGATSSLRAGDATLDKKIRDRKSVV